MKLKKISQNKAYRIKIVSSLCFLVLALAIFTLIYPKSVIKADITEEKEKTYLPEINFIESDFFLKIDKLKINVPVVADVDGSNKELYFDALEKGVAHMAGTPKPDEKGNVFIFGHSNFYLDEPGAYKQIFAHLNQLASGDIIIVNYKNQDYKYKVEKQEIVWPKDTWIISADYDLTLMTCWPPGTTEKRLVIFTKKEG